MDNKMGAYKTIKDFGRYGWKITVDTDELMYTCPVCECRMQKRYYDLEVGTRGLNFCPYCGHDMRPDQITMEV